MTAPKRPAALDDLLGFVEANLAPTEAPTPKPSLDCPGCGSEVFIRDTAAWYTDDEELCAGCGSRVMVALDEDAADPDLLTARVYIYEHGGEVVARLTEERDAIWAERVEEGKVAARAGREAAELRTRAEQAEAAHSAAAEALLVAVSWLLDMGADSTAGNAACIELLAAHRVAEYAIKRAGRVGAYTVVGATPREPGNAEYIAWSDGGMVGPAPGHGEPDQ